VFLAHARAASGSGLGRTIARTTTASARAFLGLLEQTARGSRGSAPTGS